MSYNIQEDKFSNKELNTQQKLLSKMLNFDTAKLYFPRHGDIIYSLDVIYKNDTAYVGCDITAYEGESVKTLQYITSYTGNYIPGYFSFLEGPVIVKAVEEIMKNQPPPQLIIVDGHGLAHPRKFGLACYVGVKLNLPVIGVAKQTLLPVSVADLPPGQGALAPVVLHEETVGIILRTKENSKPVFVSPGNKIDLKTAKDIILRLVSKYRIPDTLRRADSFSRK